jgi:hypothetical protein
LNSGQAGVPEQFAARPDVKSLREEYLGALEEFSAAIPSLFHERLRLAPLKEDDARLAITEPARLTTKPGEEPYLSPPFGFDSPGLNSMIEYMKGESGVIEPFALQLLCRRAEAIASDKARASNASIVLTPADFKGANDFKLVLGNFYRDTLRKLPRSQRKRAQTLCEEGLLDVMAIGCCWRKGKFAAAIVSMIKRSKFWRSNGSCAGSHGWKASFTKLAMINWRSLFSIPGHSAYRRNCDAFGWLLPS